MVSLTMPSTCGADDAAAGQQADQSGDAQPLDDHRRGDDHHHHHEQLPRRAVRAVQVQDVHGVASTWSRAQVGGPDDGHRGRIAWRSRIEVALLAGRRACGRPRGRAARRRRPRRWACRAAGRRPSRRRSRSARQWSRRSGPSSARARWTGRRARRRRGRRRRRRCAATGSSTSTGSVSGRTASASSSASTVPRWTAQRCSLAVLRSVSSSPARTHGAGVIEVVGRREVDDVLALVGDGDLGQRQVGAAEVAGDDPFERHVDHLELAGRSGRPGRVRCRTRSRR